MFLRKAELTDFETYKILFEDDNKGVSYQWLFEDKTKENISEEQTIMKTNCEDILKIAELYKNYTIEQFKDDLENAIIYMIEDNGKIIGYFKLFYYEKGKYKIEEWSMFEDNNITKKKALDKLVKLKLPRLREFRICSISKSTRDWLLENGFESLSQSFYRLEVEVKKK